MRKKTILCLYKRQFPGFIGMSCTHRRKLYSPEAIYANFNFNASEFILKEIIKDKDSVYVLVRITNTKYKGYKKLKYVKKSKIFLEYSQGHSLIQFCIHTFENIFKLTDSTNYPKFIYYKVL